MPIRVVCTCGKTLTAPDQLAGKSARCPGCKKPLQVPLRNKTSADQLDLSIFDQPPEPKTGAGPRSPISTGASKTAPRAGDTSSAAAPGRTSAASQAAPAETDDDDASQPFPWSGRLLGGYMYLIFALALIPLLVTSVQKANQPASSGSELLDRINATAQAHPEARSQIAGLASGSSLDDLLAILPDDRLDGAALPRSTEVHWVFAGLASVVFLGFLCLAFPQSMETIPWLVGIGAFTATAGIAILLGFQIVAQIAQHFWMTGGNIVVILFNVVKFIGYSYRAAEDPTNGFLYSFMGFTLGVALCEEFCKALPLLVHYSSATRPKLKWRQACSWGMISGIAFGCAEGIRYSSHYYNGIFGPQMYWVRFTSCVTLHALWSGAAGIMICKHQTILPGKFRRDLSLANWIIMVLLVISVPMVLHGLFDTLLKQGYEGYAAGVAVVTFLAFSALVSYAKRTMDTSRDRALGGHVI